MAASLASMCWPRCRRRLILAVAGLALMNTISNGLVAALKQDDQREAALITFLVTLSGISLLNIGSAFWGIVAGSISLAILHRRSARLL